jgi:hypothetical protein
MNNHPSPHITEVSHDCISHWFLNKLFIDEARNGDMQFRAQLMQDIAWYIRENAPLPRQLADYLLEAADAMAEGAAPNIAFPLNKNIMRKDALKKSMYFGKIEALRKNNELTISAAIDELEKAPEIAQLDQGKKAVWRKRIEKGYEREKTKFNNLNKKIDEGLKKK